MSLLPADAKDYRRLLEGGRPARNRMKVVGVMQYVTAFIALMTVAFSNRADAPACMLLGAMLGASAFGKLRRSQAYLMGWVQGRRVFVGSLREAGERGMSFIDWLEAEQDRTLAALDVEVTRPVPAEGMSEHNST